MRPEQIKIGSGEVEWSVGLAEAPTSYRIFGNLISKSKIPNIFVIPSSYCPLIWNGIITINQGVYKGCAFKFIILMCMNYPNQQEQPARLFFCRPPFHPQVHPTTGELDLRKKFANWDKNKNRLVEVIQYIYDIFYNINSFSIGESPLNSEAAILFAQNLKLFLKQISIKYKHEYGPDNVAIEEDTNDIKAHIDNYNDLHRIEYIQMTMLDKAKASNLDFDAIINKMKTFNKDYITMMNEEFENEKIISYSWLKH
ncbi:unnamed protein product [Gordionus sp. m RMFG-2023]